MYYWQLSQTSPRIFASKLHNDGDGSPSDSLFSVSVLCSSTLTPVLFSIALASDYEDNKLFLNHFSMHGNKHR